MGREGKESAVTCSSTPTPPISHASQVRPRTSPCNPPPGLPTSNDAHRRVRVSRRTKPCRSAGLRWPGLVACCTHGAIWAHAFALHGVGLPGVHDVGDWDLCVASVHAAPGANATEVHARLLGICMHGPGFASGRLGWGRDGDWTFAPSLLRLRGRPCRGPDGTGRKADLGWIFCRRVGVRQAWGGLFFSVGGGGKRVHAQVDQSRYSGTDHDVTRLLFGYRPRGQGSCAG